jgi:uncharacterized protein (DUF362 family)
LSKQNKKIDVVIAEDANCVYPNIPPFNPNSDYPEYPFKGNGQIDQNNAVYELARILFKHSKYDETNFGKPNWNPLHKFISPGDKVVIKPNFVLDYHADEKSIFSIITHPSLIRCLIDYCYIALDGEGEIIIADSPQMNCNFKNLISITSLESIKTLYKEILSFDIQIIDLRPFYWENRKSSDPVFQKGDPLGYVTVDLHKDSSFSKLNNQDKFYSIDRNRHMIANYHNNESHKYPVSMTILDADCIILMPKLKVHRKVGVTLNLKNLVGIVGDKRSLPHFRLGSPPDGGDSFPNVLNFQARFLLKIHNAYNDYLTNKNDANILIRYLWELYRMLPTPSFLMKIPFINSLLISTYGNKDDKYSSFEGGSWYGNDTAWRMVNDLNKIFYYSDKKGNMRSQPQRNVFSMIDGIMGGETDGPLVPEPKHCGILIAGDNPLAVDIVAIRLMGYDYRKLPLYSSFLKLKKWGILSTSEILDITVESNNSLYSNVINNSTSKYLNFNPHIGWKNKIEFDIT